MTPEPRHVVYSQPSGFSIRQYEISRDCPRYLVRHRSRCGTGLWILTVLSIMASLPSRSYGDPDGDKGCQNQNVVHTRKLRGFPPGNPRNREIALDTSSDISSDLADAFDYLSPCQSYALQREVHQSCRTGETQLKPLVQKDLSRRANFHDADNMA